MLRLDDCGDAVIDFIVQQQRAQKRLFCLDIMRLQPVTARTRNPAAIGHAACLDLCLKALSLGEMGARCHVDHRESAFCARYPLVPYPRLWVVRNSAMFRMA